MSEGLNEEQMRAVINEMRGIDDHELKKELARHLAGSPVDETIDVVGDYIKSHDIDTAENMNKGLDHLTDEMRKHITFVETRSQKAMQDTSVFLDYMYLGYLVHTYRDHLFAPPPEGE